jgi:hypothetical protein
MGETLPLSLNAGADAFAFLARVPTDFDYYEATLRRRTSCRAPVAARRYGLQLGRHAEGIVDAYYGPPELAAAVDEEPPVDPRTLVSAADALLDELEEGRVRSDFAYQVTRLSPLARLSIRTGSRRVSPFARKATPRQRPTGVRNASTTGTPLGAVKTCCRPQREAGAGERGRRQPSTGTSTWDRRRVLSRGEAGRTCRNE